MANHARVYRKNGYISKKELDDILDDINKKYFKSLLPIEKEKGPSTLLVAEKNRREGF